LACSTTIHAGLQTILLHAPDHVQTPWVIPTLQMVLAATCDMAKLLRLSLVEATMGSCEVILPESVAPLVRLVDQQWHMIQNQPSSFWKVPTTD